MAEKAYTAKLYYAEIEEFAKHFRTLYEALPQVRRACVDRVKMEADKYRSLTAGTLLTAGLSAYGISKEQIDRTYCTDEYGRPFLENCPVCFNLSHSGRYVIAVFAEADVGCDVERVQSGERIEQTRKLAQRFFTETENRYLETVYRERTADYSGEFTRIWSYKESYMKALGQGLRLPMDLFSVTDGECLLRNLGDFSFTELSLDADRCSADYRAVVCLHQTIRELLVESSLPALGQK